MGSIRVCWGKILLGFPESGAKAREAAGSDVAVKEYAGKAAPLQKAQEWATRLQKRRCREPRPTAANSNDLQRRGDGSEVEAVSQTR